MKSEKSWYPAKKGNHQGLVVEEETGRDIAVAYDKDDAGLLAAAPELLESVIALLHEFAPTFGKSKAVDQARAAIAKAEGR